MIQNRRELSKEPPEHYEFLGELSDSFSLDDDGVLAKFDRLTIELRYTSSHSTFIEFDESEATIHLDVRFVETIVDLLSCVGIGDHRESAARAFLIIYGMALDLCVGCRDDQMAMGFVQDYTVSRVTAELEIGQVLSSDLDFSGEDLRTVAEMVSTFVCAHEIVHWLMDHDHDFRAQAMRRFANLARSYSRFGYLATDGFAHAWDEIAMLCESGSGNATLPDLVEECICDYFSSMALSRAVTSPVSRKNAEAAVYASSMVLWAKARMSRILDGKLDRMTEIDTAFGLQRAGACIAPLMMDRVELNDGDFDLIKETPHLEAMNRICDQAIVGFMSGQNISRLIAIGSVSGNFGLTNPDRARDAIAKIRDWE